MGRKMVAFLLIVLLLRISPFYYGLRSVVIMWPYSQYHHYMSLLRQKNMKVIEKPCNRDSQKSWHPLMLVFHDSTGFSAWTGKPYELTILYRFGGFPDFKKHSSYFQRDSQRFSSFYGAYLVYNTKNPQDHFGYDPSGKLIPEAFMRVTEYDQRFLVMPSIGLHPQDVIFEVSLQEVVSEKAYLGYENWTRVDALIRTNSPEHHYQNDQRGYLQYGIPLAPPDGTKDYAPVELYGRIYATVIEPHNISLALYILAPDLTILNEIDACHLATMQILFE